MKKPVSLQPYELTLSEAQSRIGRYGETMSFLIEDYNREALIPLSENFVKAFWIPIEDINCLIDMVREKDISDVDGVRVYLGLVGDENGESKLTLSINATQLQENGVHKDIVFDSTETSGIYDFIEPCPPACDASSPLMDPYKP